jgi:aspartyl-tRNA(Asn)/glutamyl-tRNA(Gln) amidotransferase subunit A
VRADVPASIAEAGESLRSRRISSLELTQALLGQAKANQDTVGAFVMFTEEAAVTAAARADDELARGIDRGPLHGIPLGIKDILATADAPTTANSRVLAPEWGRRGDASVVRRLRDAGAVILGKLVLHEFAVGWPDPSTGLRFARNPWDPARTPGGSSSGTGAAVAAGFILGGLGTDTGGSIRAPAAYCGISGLKATFGRVSKAGCVPLSYSLDHIGPMARTARDCAMLLHVIAGFDPLDPCSVSEPVPDYVAGLSGSIGGVRLGIARNEFYDVPELDAEVRATVLDAVNLMSSAGGARLVDVAVPHTQLATIAQRAIMFSEAYTYHLGDLQSRPELYGKYTRQQLQQGALYSAADFVQAQRVRSMIRDEWNEVLAGVDALVLPTTLTAAPAFKGYDPDAMRRMPTFVGIWNLVGLPAASICCGFTSAGLPVGLQIVGKPFDETTVLRIGDAYQRLTDWHTRTPSLEREVQAV